MFIFPFDGNTRIVKGKEGIMRQSKVEICGVDTSTLAILREDEKRELLLRAQNGDMQARERLILGNLRLVLSVSGRFHSKCDSADDLFQIGCIGLIKAIDHFNLDLDVRFSTYAVPMIIGEIRRYLRDNNAMRVSRGLRDLAYRALLVREEISVKESRDATTAELATRLGVSEREICSAMEAIVEPMSLYDSAYNDGDDTTYVIDQVKDEEQSDDAFIENLTLKDALGTLNERELGIINRRFYKGRTQMEIAEEIGISQAQVSRIEKGAIEKLRRYME